MLQLRLHSFFSFFRENRYVCLFVEGTDKQCDVNGDAVVIPGITNDPCIECQCLVSDSAHIFTLTLPFYYLIIILLNVLRVYMKNTMPLDGTSKKYSFQLILVIGFVLVTYSK